MDGRMQILIADDHPLFRMALRGAIAAAFPDAEISEAGDLDGALAEIERAGGMDLVLLDLRMPGAHGFSGLIFLRGRHPEIPVVVVSGAEERAVIARAIERGASGFIPKSTPPQTISEALARIVDGEVWTPPGAIGCAAMLDPAAADFAARVGELSPQQFKVLTLIGRGLLNKQIAHELDLSLSTVKAHTTALLKKLRLQRRTQVLAAMRTLDVEPEFDPSADSPEGG